jgi:hypothetical protein
MLPYIRQRPQSTKLWLSIYKPRTILACRVNDSGIDVGEETITYDGVTTGSYLNIRPGMTLLVGSSPDARDYGKLRIKDSTGTYITVAENSEIDWQDDAYLTVKSFYEIWPVFPYYVQSGEDVTFYKDKNIAYTNQNSDEGLGSLVCMGTHFAGFAGSQVYYTSTGTVSVSNQTPLSYSWIFEGGSPTGSTSATPGLVTYNTPGHYTTRLVVSTSQGIQDISYRHVSIYNRPGSGTSVPIQKWELDSFDGSRDEGGYTAKFLVWENIEDIVDGALVVLFAEDAYGTDYISIGGNAENRSSIVFAGYILDGSIAYNYQDSRVEFEVVSSAEIMKKQMGLSISIDSVANPSTWYELEDLDVLKALYHYFRWHSTLLNTTDLRYVGTNYKFEYFDTESASLYDAMASFLQSSLLGSLICDRQNSLYAEVGAETYDDITDIPYDMDILRQDWMNEPEITVRTNKDIAYLELSGVAWSGVSTGTWEEFIAAAPGNSLSYYGNMDSQTGLILTTQTDLNILVGNVFAYRNSIYPEVAMEIAGNYRNLDIVPLKRELLTINRTDTHKGIVFNRKAFHISSISWEYNPLGQSFFPSITLAELTHGFPGVTILRPETPISNYPELPPIDLPPFPIIPIPTPNPLPPPIVPNPPPGDPVCITDDAAPQNVHQLWVSAELRSDLGAIDQIEGWLGCFLRRDSATFHSAVEIYGRWEKSVDGGSTWEEWLENDYWGVKSDPESVAGRPDQDPWPPGTEYRAFWFDGLVNAFEIQGVYVFLEPTTTTVPQWYFTGTSTLYWAHGPFPITFNVGESVQYHTGTVNITAIPGTSTAGWFAFRYFYTAKSPDDKGISSINGSVWGASSSFGLTPGQWAWHNRAGGNVPPLPGVDETTLCLNLFGTGTLGNNVASFSWDGETDKTAYQAFETFPQQAKNISGELYMIMYGDQPPIYRITIYEIYLWNVCFPPSTGIGGYE